MGDQQTFNEVLADFYDVPSDASTPELFARVNKFL